MYGQPFDCAQGRAVSELSLDEMERLWQAAKLALRSPRPKGAGSLALSTVEGAAEEAREREA